MYKSRLRTWLAFSAWVVGAFLCGFVDHVRQSTIFLPAYSLATIFIVVVATRKHRPPKYRFEVSALGGVRSPLGFEVSVSNSTVRYIEGDHVVSWHSIPADGSVARFGISAQGIVGWDDPFGNEPMSTEKKQEIVTAVLSASIYLELVEAGKIRPKVRASALS
jgi:hypothetical protein